MIHCCKFQNREQRLIHSRLSVNICATDFQIAGQNLHIFNAFTMLLCYHFSRRAHVKYAMSTDQLQDSNLDIRRIVNAYISLMLPLGRKEKEIPMKTYSVLQSNMCGVPCYLHKCYRFENRGRLIQSRVVIKCFRENNLWWILKARLGLSYAQRRAIIPGGENESSRATVWSNIIRG